VNVYDFFFPVLSGVSGDFHMGGPAVHCGERKV